MIEIFKKEDCCGCTACKQICPKHCINLNEDKEGFLYPMVNHSICINCGLCEKVCPILTPKEERFPISVYAGKLKNDTIRKVSSSGGMFTLLAEQIINQGGVVFGAKFNENWEVVHSYTETMDGIAPLRRSKYVQSNINNTFQTAERFLKQGRKVLFVGTPCQTTGLKKYLCKEYENLLTVDFVCHGVPSPKVWRKYLDWIKTDHQKDRRQFIEINFRDKSTGWKNYSITYATSGKKKTQRFQDNPYMQAFLANLTLRPSCYNCQFKKGQAESDITIGDFWGIERLKPTIDDDLGVSLIMIHNPKAFDYLNVGEMVEMTYENARLCNASIEDSAPRPIYRYIYLFMTNILNRFVIPQQNNIIIRLLESFFRKKVS